MFGGNTHRNTRVPHPFVTGVTAALGAVALSFSAAAQNADDDDFIGDAASLEEFGTDWSYEGEYVGPEVRSASGRIERIDLPQGKLVIDGRIYRADPRNLEGLQPGQHVSLVYEAIEDQAWISELQLDEPGFGLDPYGGPVF